MKLHVELLEHAGQLLGTDRRGPRQVHLRRAVSSAYYGVFHMLVGEAATLFVKDEETVARLARTFNHKELRTVADKFRAGQLPKSLAPVPAGLAIPIELKTVAEHFITLQETRHSADYDLARRFTRKEVQECLDDASECVAAWGSIRRTDVARLFLACFLLWERWDKPPR